MPNICVLFHYSIVAAAAATSTATYYDDAGRCHDGGAAMATMNLDPKVRMTACVNSPVALLLFRISMTWQKHSATYLPS